MFPPHCLTIESDTDCSSNELYEGEGQEGEDSPIYIHRETTKTQVKEQEDKYAKVGLTEERVRKIRILNSLLKLQKHLDNAKTCIISALVYIDRLSEDDVIFDDNMHW